MQNAEKLFPRLRRQIDEAYSRWGGVVATYPWRTIAFCVLAIGLILPQARKVEVTTNTEEFLLPDHPIRVAYSDFKDRFGSDNYALITLRHDDIFSADFLEWLTALHEEIEDRVPYVNEITSLVNVRSTRGEGDELIVGDLLEDWPRDAESLARLAALVESTPFHQRLVLGDDGRHTSIQIELQPYETMGSEDELGGFGDSEGLGDSTDGAHSDLLDEETGEADALARHGPLTGAQEKEVTELLREILDDFARPDVTAFLAGTPVMNVRIFEDMGRNLVLFIVLSTLMVGVVLAFVFRRASAVFLPLLVVFLSLAGMMGIVGLRGEPVNMSIQILPSFLLAVGSSSSIHLLVIFFQQFDRGASKREALVHAFAHAAAPITLACLTTAVGLASFIVANVAPVRQIGFMAPIGILIGLVLCLSLLPALLIVAPIRRRAARSTADTGALVEAVVRVGDFGNRHPIPVLAVTALIVAVSCLGVLRVQFDHDALNFFPPVDPIHENTEITDRFMAGSASIELLVDTGRENGLHDPEIQRALDRFERELQEIGPDRDTVRKTISVNGVLKEIHQALNENDPGAYTTPDDRVLIAQELLLFENSGSDDLEDLVDSQFQTARISIRSIWGSGSFYAPFLERVEALARETFPTSGVRATGLVPIVMTSMIESENGMKSSYALALMTITPLMILLIGSLRGGLSSMVPNLAPIAIVVGMMGWLDIRFDVFTIMTGSVAIGLAVDDTIHFLHGFYREFERTGDTRASIRHTLETTGEALLTTSLVLSIGFSVFLFATMPTLVTFGLITTLAILIAFVADILIAPALVTLATRHRASIPGVTIDSREPDSGARSDAAAGR